MGTFKAHTGVISALTFDQDWLYSSSWDGFVKVFLVLSLPQYIFKEGEHGMYPLVWTKTQGLKPFGHLTNAVWMFAFFQAWPLQDVLSGGPIPVERKCNQAAVTALTCSGQDKLFVGTAQKIQVFSKPELWHHILWSKFECT